MKKFVNLGFRSAAMLSEICLVKKNVKLNNRCLEGWYNITSSIQSLIKQITLISLHIISSLQA